MIFLKADKRDFLLNNAIIRLWPPDLVSLQVVHTVPKMCPRTGLVPMTELDSSSGRCLFEVSILCDYQSHSPMKIFATKLRMLTLSAHFLPILHYFRHHIKQNAQQDAALEPDRTEPKPAKSEADILFTFETRKNSNAFSHKNQFHSKLEGTSVNDVSDVHRIDAILFLFHDGSRVHSPAFRRQ